MEEVDAGGYCQAHLEGMLVVVTMEAAALAVVTAKGAMVVG